ncbi:DUF3310 domain-containing protein [Macrococcus armenti]|uniref:DUF3310 domain-containing protein n=1 Tax=Macrococcus armenti TaxID=2875764 RepID=UPI001CCB1E0B|nr:DUF3310 domain-containing protein [Macrococcus armenti]UBH16384.1 DUF3310 domain-containing protein [Macrococcus armenti]UBH18740.1 DUF3310 domain-containing protein [Macrococcus armenti]UBH21012.1 DUF3310 domain-containing protein [Macrococcus armenti]
MAKMMDKYTVIQVYEMLKAEKSPKKVAEKLGVSLATLNAFRYDKQNKKQFDALKKADAKKEADKEMGLVIEDKPVVKTVNVSKEKDKRIEELENQNETLQRQIAELEKRVKDDEVAINDYSTRLNQYVEKHKKLDELISEKDDKIAELTQKREHNFGKSDIIESKDKEIKQLNDTLSRKNDEISRLKKKKDEVEVARKKATSELNERSRKYESLMKTATKDFEANQKEIKALKAKNAKHVNDAMEIDIMVRQIESEHAEKSLEQSNRIAELEKTVDDWKGKFYDLANAHSALEDEHETLTRKLDEGSLVTNISDFPIQIHPFTPNEAEITEISRNMGINPPSHYRAKDSGMDVIQFLESQMSAEAYKGFMIGNILKYATRTGRKDEEVKELDKIIDYAQRMKESIESGRLNGQ